MFINILQIYIYISGSFSAFGLIGCKLPPPSLPFLTFFDYNNINNMLVTTYRYNSIITSLNSISQVLYCGTAHRLIHVTLLYRGTSAHTCDFTLLRHIGSYMWPYFIAAHRPIHVTLLYCGTLTDTCDITLLRHIGWYMSPYFIAAHRRRQVTLLYCGTSAQTGDLTLFMN